MFESEAVANSIVANSHFAVDGITLTCTWPQRQQGQKGPTSSRRGNQAGSVQTGTTKVQQQMHQQQANRSVPVQPSYNQALASLAYPTSSLVTPAINVPSPQMSAMHFHERQQMSQQRNRMEGGYVRPSDPLQLLPMRDARTFDHEQNGFMYPTQILPKHSPSTISSTNSSVEGSGSLFADNELFGSQDHQDFLSSLGSTSSGFSFGPSSNSLCALLNDSVW